MLVAHARRGEMNFLVVGFTAVQIAKLSMDKPVKVNHISHSALPRDLTVLVFGGKDDQALVDKLAQVGFIDRAEEVRTTEPVVMPPRSYPEGRIAPDDDGELNFRLGHNPKSGKIIMDWGKPVSWLAFGPEDAVKLATGLLEHAYELKPELTPPAAPSAAALKLIEENKLTDEEVEFALRLAVQRKIATKQAPWDGKEPF